MSKPENRQGLSLDEIKKIASLARLRLSDKESATAQGDLSGILGHFAKIQTVDTKGVATSDDVTGSKNVTRPDQANSEALCTVESLLEAAPERKGQHVKVRAVFKE